MSLYNQSIPTTVLPQAIAPAGIRAHQFTNYMIGIIDCDTNLTVDAASYYPDKKYEIVFKHGHTGANNSMFPDQFGARLPMRLPVTKVTKAFTFEDGNAPAKNFVGYLGWDGISDCKSLNLECDQEYGLQITVRNREIRSVFGRNLTEIIPFTTPCCGDCNLEASCDKSIDALLDRINKYRSAATDSYYVLNYVDLHKVKSCCPESDPFDRKLYHDYEITFCDNGTGVSLGKIQRAYPGIDISFDRREDCESTYTACIATPISAADQVNLDALQVTIDELDQSSPTYATDLAEAQEAYDSAYEAAVSEAIVAAQPEPYTRSKIKALVCDECPDCPAIFNKVDAGDKLIACFNTAAAAGTTNLEEFTLDYYADPITGQTDIDALVEAAALLIPGFVAGNDVTVLNATCDKLTLQVCVTKDTVITEHGVEGLTLTNIGTCTGYCEGTETTPWCPTEPSYKITRSKCVTFKKEDCLEGTPVIGAVEDGAPISRSSDLFVEMFELLQDVEDVDINTLEIVSDNDCLVTFKVSQCSNCVQDGCDTFGKDGAKFKENFPAYKGIAWMDCDCDGWSFDSEGCPQAPENLLPENCQCGIKFEGKYVMPQTAHPCDHSIADVIEREPVEVEVTLIRQYSDATRCEIEDIDFTVVQRPVMPQGLGQYVLRAEVLTSFYDLGIYIDPKEALGSLMQRAVGYEFSANPNKRYNRLEMFFDTDASRSYYRHDSPLRHNITVAVDADNVVLLEELKTFFNKTILRHGLCNLT